MARLPLVFATPTQHAAREDSSHFFSLLCLIVVCTCSLAATRAVPVLVCCYFVRCLCALASSTSTSTSTSTSSNTGSTQYRLQAYGVRRLARSRRPNASSRIHWRQAAVGLHGLWMACPGPPCHGWRSWLQSSPASRLPLAAPLCWPATARQLLLPLLRRGVPSARAARQRVGAL